MPCWRTSVAPGARCAWFDLDRPDLSILCLEDAVLGIVDDALLRIRRGRAAYGQDCENKGNDTDHGLLHDA
jgi:hypothetical protein